MTIFNHLKYWKFAGRLFSNKGSTPLYLIFFVTSYCNLKCRHCFYWKELNVKRSELSLIEIEKIAKNMDKLLMLRLTGGEPVLRNDLPEIVKIFYDNNNLRNVGINTSGFFTEKIIRDAEKILLLCPGLELEVCVSIDDVGRFHDLNRGMPDTYKNAIATIKNLKAVREKYNRLRINAGLCVTNKNQDRLNEIFDTVLAPLGVDTIQVNIVRGAPKEPSLVDVDLVKYAAFLEKTGAYNKKQGYHGLYVSSAVKDMLMSSVIMRSIQEKKFQGVYCNAGNKVGVLYSDGSLHPCELLENMNIGSLRDNNYDFRALWNSLRAEDVRKFIHDTKCFCTHECFLTAALLLEPKNIVNYVKAYAYSKFEKKT